MDEFEGLFQIDRKGSKAGDSDAGKKSGQKKRKGSEKESGQKSTHLEKDAEEQELEHLLFGTSEPAVSTLESAEEPEEGLSIRTSKKAKDVQVKKPVWHDVDDDDLTVDIDGVDRLKKLRKTEDETALQGPEYSTRLRQQFGKLNPAVSWATRRLEGEDDEVWEKRLLQSTGSLLGKGGGRLPQSSLEIERMKDANVADVSDAVVQSVRFHPNSQLMLTAGFDRRLKLFQIDGRTNSKVQGVFFKDMPISTAEFSADGSEVFLSGRRKFFYVYDLAAAAVKKIHGIMGHSDKSLSSLFVSPDNKYIVVLGNCGKVSMLSRQTKQWVADLKMNHAACTAAFSPDGRSIFTAGGGGLVYHWDLRMRKCIKRIVDEGSLDITSLAMSSDGQLLAVGSRSGVVNTYDMHQVDALPIGPSGTVEPASRKAIMNLTTQVSSMRFNCDGQLLGIASDYKKEALKMVHTATSSVFSNWPTFSTPLHHVSSMDFSPNSGMVAIGNDRGKVLANLCSQTLLLTPSYTRAYEASSSRSTLLHTDR